MCGAFSCCCYASTRSHCSRIVAVFVGFRSFYVVDGCVVFAMCLLVCAVVSRLVVILRVHLFDCYRFVVVVNFVVFPNSFSYKGSIG